MSKKRTIQGVTYEVPPVPVVGMLDRDWIERGGEIEWPAPPSGTQLTEEVGR